MVKEVINTLYDASMGRSDCGESTTSRQRRQHRLPEKNCQIQFVWGGHWSFATKIVGFEHRFFSYLQCLLKKIYLSNQTQSTIRHTFTKEKNYWTKGGGVGSTPWAHPLIRPWWYQCFTHWWRELRTWLNTIKLIKTSTNSHTNNNNSYLNIVKIEANTTDGAVYILIKNMLMKISKHIPKK